ncbi:MAG: hypothetical protein GF368_00935 [Candidatus Aenigmarchaeota archaeon]|nr:hypothetical protein [Candidatus Aenigmarchaeota archaeon]
MIEIILLIASFLVLGAVALEAKVKSNLGKFIVLTGLLVGVVDLIYVIVKLLR